MSKFEALINKYQFEEIKDVYIVGTGPSMRVFPIDFLRDKFVIGLNQAYKYFAPDYWPIINLTIHPELIPKEGPLSKGWWTKVKGTSVKNWEDHVIFRTNSAIGQTVLDYSLLRNRKPGFLYTGRGIHTSGLALAGAIGAKNVILVGVDCCDLDGEHHGHEQHIQFHNLSPDNVYDEYYLNAVEVRKIIYEVYGTRTLSITPFIGLDHYAADYYTLKNYYQLKPLPTPKDISTYKRNDTDFKL